MQQAFLYLMIYSFLGWLCESLYVSVGQKQWINSGFLHGPFCPIYGFGSIFVIYLLEPFINHPFLVFILGVLITSTLEYFTSWLLETLFQIRWWDYSHYKYHINGRVCLLNSCLFGLMSIFVLYFLHPIITQYTLMMSNSTIIGIDILLLIYLMIDLFFSTAQLLNFKQQYAQFEIAMEDLKKELKKQLNEVELKEKVEEYLPQKIETIKNNIEQRKQTFHTNKKLKRLNKAFPHLKLKKR